MPTAPLRRAIVACALLLALAVPATAHANYQELLKDACRGNSQVDGTYSQKDYRDALANLPADADQYTDCRDVLLAAQRASAGSEGGGGTGGGGAGSGSSFVPVSGGDPLISATPVERAAVEQGVADAVSGAGAPVTVGGALIRPGSLGAGREVASKLSDLPLPLLIALAIVALSGLGALTLVALPRLRARNLS